MCLMLLLFYLEVEFKESSDPFAMNLGIKWHYAKPRNNHDLMHGLIHKTSP